MALGRAVVVLLAIAVCVSCGGGASPAREAPEGPTPITILQEDAHVLADPTATLDIARSLGVSEMRIFIRWSAFAPDATSRTPPPGFDPTDPAAYPATAWAPYDAAVRAAAARGIGVYFLLTGPAPLWAATAPPKGIATHAPGVYEPSALLFGEFVRAVATRYDGSYVPPGSTAPLPRVRFWSFWDEPNYGPNLQPQAIDGIEIAPSIYRGLLDAGWSALHATGHGSDTILIGETAPRGANFPGVANGMVPLRFLRALYCVDSSYRVLSGSTAAARGCPTTPGASSRFPTDNPALFLATGFAAHLYTSGQTAPPDQPTSANEPDYAGLADLPELEQALDRLTAVYGSHAQLPIYNTEFGFQTNPPTPVCGCVFLSPTTAADYLNWSEYLMWSDPRVRSDSQYLLYDGAVPGNLNESDFASGIEFANGMPKADYAAFLLPVYLPVTSTRPGERLELWGDVRPARYADRDTRSIQRVAIQFQPAAGGAWRALRTVTITNPAGYFELPVAFPSSGSVRLAWSYPPRFTFLPPGTPRIVTSRVVKVTVG
jgi:hypothetical protein